jgi:uncharacterized caspase-like protein
MTGNRYALLIAASRFEDPGLRRLVAPSEDVESLARVLEKPTIGNFSVCRLIDETSYRVASEIEQFFAERKREDMALLYFSGHGLKDEDGNFYFAALNTNRRLLRSTAVTDSLVSDVANRSRCRQQLIILDCCYSGSFAHRMMGKGDTAVNLGERFKGRGRAVLTASDSTQYAFEGDTLSGQAVRSVFTESLIAGLDTGEADLDGDGLISIDDLYSYVYERVVDHTPAQRPAKWDFVQGKLIVAQSIRPLRPADLPDELRQALDQPLALVRLGAVQELAAMRRSNDPRLSLAVENQLRHMQMDDSERVRKAVAELLSQSVGAAPEPGPGATELTGLMPPSERVPIRPPEPGPTTARVPPKATLPDPALALSASNPAQSSASPSKGVDSLSTGPGVAPGKPDTGSGAPRAAAGELVQASIPGAALATVNLPAAADSPRDDRPVSSRIGFWIGGIGMVVACAFVGSAFVAATLETFGHSKIGFESDITRASMLAIGIIASLLMIIIVWKRR